MNETQDGQAQFRVALAAVAARCGVELPAGVEDAWVTHYGLLVRWNRTHNLTRIVDAADAALKHYLDCGVPVLDPGLLAGVGASPARVIDVGSGAGFPGLVAGMVWQATVWRGTPWAGGPAPELVLVEPARKRQSFLQVAAKAVGVACRTEMPAPTGALTGSVVLTRATFSGGLRQSLWPYVAEGGVLVAWTTPHELAMWQEEARTWPGATSTARQYQMDGLDRRIFVARKG